MTKENKRMVVMGDSFNPPVVLVPVMRVKMLQSMCVDSRMSVCDKEIG